MAKRMMLQLLVVVLVSANFCRVIAQDPVDPQAMSSPMMMSSGMMMSSSMMMPTNMMMTTTMSGAGSIYYQVVSGWLVLGALLFTLLS